jgi:hypothetical protein
MQAMAIWQVTCWPLRARRDRRLLKIKVKCPVISNVFLTDQTQACGADGTQAADDLHATTFYVHSYETAKKFVLAISSWSTASQ